MRLVRKNPVGAVAVRAAAEDFLAGGEDAADVDVTSGPAFPTARNLFVRSKT